MNKELEQTKSKLEKELEEQIKSNLIIERDATKIKRQRTDAVGGLKKLQQTGMSC